MSKTVPTMKNPLRALASLFQRAGQPLAPPKESPPPVTAPEPAIKVEVPPDVAAAAAAAAASKPKPPRESYKQHNREIEQRVKSASLHRPTIIRSVPHARGR